MYQNGPSTLRLLGEGRIDGITFVASCIGALSLEVVERSRKWIAERSELVCPNVAKPTWF